MFPWRKGKEKLIVLHGASQTCGFSWGLGTFKRCASSQENLVILMISSDSLLGKPMSTWRFPKSWVLLRFKNAWGCTSKHLSSTHTLACSSLKNPWYMEFLKRTGGGFILSPSSDTPRREPTRTWRYSCSHQKNGGPNLLRVALLALVSTLDGWEHVSVCLKRIYGGSHILKWYFLNLWILLRVGNMWGCVSRESSRSHTLRWSSLKRNHKCRILPYSIPLSPFYQGQQEHLCRSLSQSTLFLHNFHKLWSIGNYQIYILLLITLSTYAGIIFQ